jgi:hypothetical protein
MVPTNTILRNRLAVYAIRSEESTSLEVLDGIVIVDALAGSQGVSGISYIFTGEGELDAGNPYFICRDDSFLNERFRDNFNSMILAEEAWERARNNKRSDSNTRLRSSRREPFYLQTPVSEFISSESRKNLVDEIGQYVAENLGALVRELNPSGKFPRNSREYKDQKYIIPRIADPQTDRIQLYHIDPNFV